MLKGLRKTSRGYRYESLFKVCTKCQTSKPVEDFPFKNTSRGIRHSVCKDCTAQRSSNRYYSDPQRHIQVVNRTRRAYLADHARYVWDYLSENPCVDCGEDNPILLEFDHIEGMDKVERVSQMVTSGYSLERIIDEIEKCEVRCANCHRRRTALQLNWHLSHSPRRNRDVHQDINRQYVNEYLSTHPCVDCGEEDSVVLEFDHRGEKDESIAKMVADGYSLATIKREIAKCDVRCANCHRMRTANQRDWFKWLSR